MVIVAGMRMQNEQQRDRARLPRVCEVPMDPLPRERVGSPAMTTHITCAFYRQPHRIVE
jgi:hypothetical protein